MPSNDHKDLKRYIDIVFDGPPSHVTGRFVEVENTDGASINFGEWVERDNGYWVLRIPDCARVEAENKRLQDALEKVGIFLKSRARKNRKLGLPRYQRLYDEIECIDIALTTEETNAGA